RPCGPGRSPRSAFASLPIDKSALFERRIRCAGKLRQPRIDIFEVDTQRTTTALQQHLEVAAGLRCLHDAEAIGMAGHVDIHRIIAGDLQEYTGIRAAFVGLPGRMLEARSEAEA